MPDERQFSPDFDFAPARHTRTLVIASTGRSGSHMLGRTLRQTGAFGYPLEYLHPDNLRHWGRITGAKAPLDIVRAIIRRRTSANGVFGIKLHYSQLFGFPDVDGLLDTLVSPFFVHLTREDALAQAVSYSIAVQTGEWIGHAEGHFTNARYDRKLIDRCLREVAADNAGWTHLLCGSGFEWMPLRFEAVQADPASAIAAIARCAAIPVSDHAKLVELATRKQSDSRNVEWARRFRQERRHAPQMFLTLRDAPRQVLRRLRRLALTIAARSEGSRSGGREQAE